jgi:hypothetical protein
LKTDDAEKLDLMGNKQFQNDNSDVFSKSLQEYISNYTIYYYGVNDGLLGTVHGVSSILLRCVGICLQNELISNNTNENKTMKIR